MSCASFYHKCERILWYNYFESFQSHFDRKLQYNNLNSFIASYILSISSTLILLYYYYIYRVSTKLNSLIHQPVKSTYEKNIIAFVQFSTHSVIVIEIDKYTGLERLCYINMHLLGVLNVYVYVI